MTVTDSRPDARRSRWAQLDRVLRTRVLDLLGGQVRPYVRTPRLRAHDVIAQADLPGELADLVGQVVRRTRLWPTEEVAVAHELVAHFQDGLAAGVACEELRSTFGDVPQVAALIRRAKRRKRPLWWRVPKTGLQAIGAVVLLALAIYTVQAVRIYGGVVRVTRDYVAEWNAAALAIPDAERAWPLYKQAALALGPCPQRWSLRFHRPGGDAWPQLVEYVAHNQAAATLFRQASGRTHVGAVLLDDQHELWMRMDETFTAAPPPRPEGVPAGSDHTVSVWPVAALRAGARLLEWDALVAAEQGDTERAANDVLAVAAIVDHAFEPRWLETDMVATDVADHLFKTVGTILAEHPRLFDDAQLRRTAHRLTVLGGREGLRVSFASERLAVVSALERYFTDDGQGGGLPRPEILIEHSRGVERRAKYAALTARCLMPALSLVMLDRQDAAALADSILGEYEELTRTPLWQRRGRGVDAKLADRWQSPFPRLRELPLPDVISALDYPATRGEYVQQLRDATLVALALELYHREHGEYPERLEQLTPDLLPTVPPDRYDGKSIKYCLVDGRPLLYSIGVDRDDDGGCLAEPLPASPYQTRFSPNQRARNFQSPGVVERLRGAKLPPGRGIADGDWLLWPPVE